MRGSREALAGYVHANPDDLVYVPNATQGVNVVARSLNLQPGDEILASDHEYGACDYTWQFLCGKTGAKYLHQQIPFPLSEAEPGSEAEDRMAAGFWQAVTPRTKVIFLSHITSATALRLPVEQICRRARKAGIFTIVDGAHALGQVPLDLQSVGADFYTSNCHKWALSPKGAAFLYARREVQNLIEPLVVSWGYHPNEMPTTGSQFVDYLQWSGTKDPAAALAVPDALKFMDQYRWDQVRRECHDLLGQTIARICHLTSLPLPYPIDSDLYGQMGVAPLPATSDLVTLKYLLYDEFRVEVPLIEWEGRKFVRVSVQGYNDQSDMDALLAALESLLPRVVA